MDFVIHYFYFHTQNSSEEMKHEKNLSYYKIISWSWLQIIKQTLYVKSFINTVHSHHSVLLESSLLETQIWPRL